MDSDRPVHIDDLLQDEPDELTTGDVARIRGLSRSQAWRWLTQLHEKHGSKIVRKRRRGIRQELLISRRHLAMLIQSASGRNFTGIIVRLREFEQRLLDQEKRLDAHAQEPTKRRRFE